MADGEWGRGEGGAGNGGWGVGAGIFSLTTDYTEGTDKTGA